MSQHRGAEEQPDPSHRLPHLPDLLNPVRHLKVMGRLVRRAPTRPGSSPGTLVHTGEKKVDEVRITLLDYDGEELREREPETLEECFPLRDTSTVSWINVDGLHDVEAVRRLGEHFGVHPLVLEDVVGVGQRPKVEEYDDYLFVILHMLSYDAEAGHVGTEQLGLLLGPTYVVTFQERPGDVFDSVRERIRSEKSRIRTRGPDYLAYALIDAVVDSYYGILEQVGDRVEGLDLGVMARPDPGLMRHIHDLKREMLVVRRAVWPVRDLMASVLRSEHRVVGEETKVYLRDVYDHSVQILDTVEIIRDLASGLSDLYLSSLGNRTNEIMKVLTIIGSIFIPLTFVAGVYGMNFEHMPELEWRWAYPAVLGLMAAIGFGMLLFFRWRKWI